AGIRRAVVAMTDPDPRTAGRGLAHLQEAGVAVRTGVGEERARAINQGFWLRVTAGRPFVAIKLATSLDGRIAARTGHARWITGKRARTQAHLLRARHDAILIGGRTQRHDDPLLTCRLPGLEAASPIRIVLTRTPHLDPGSRLMRSADKVPVWLVGPAGGTADLPPPDPEEPGRPGLYALTLPDQEEENPTRLVSDLLRNLAEAGITRLLVEGGGMVAGLFLRAGLFDRLYHFTGNCVIGADGIAAVSSLGVADVATDAPRLRLLASHSLEESVLSVYEPMNKA
ncbi:MAG: bifunctional diaminohydroxyphosphoribosylaminopyrimidine deaminase/5-amino-6-(5-phosphoribosylamino)uracil reductase RibD, partial [Alphaproteobacteria bacterium]